MSLRGYFVLGGTGNSILFRLTKVPNMMQMIDATLTRVDVIPGRYVRDLLRVLGLPELRTEALRLMMRERGFWRIDYPHLNKAGQSTRARDWPVPVWHVRGLGPCIVYVSDRVQGPVMIWDSPVGELQVTAEQRAVLMWRESVALAIPDGRAERWKDKPGRNFERARIASEMRYHARLERGTALRFKALDAVAPKAPKRVCRSGCGSTNLWDPYSRCKACQTAYRAAHRRGARIAPPATNMQPDPSAEKAVNLARGSSIRAERKRLMRESAEYAADLARRRAAGEVIPDPETLKPEWVE